jgi:Flp pilus assembly pilin Flp
MDNSLINFFSRRRLYAARGQGLVEYAVLLGILALVTISALTLTGGSVEKGFVKICAELGNDDCQAAEDEPVVLTTATPTAIFTAPPPTPTATLALADPDPTRPPVVTVVVVEPTATPTTAPEELVTMRIKVVVTGKDTSSAGIRVVLYDASGSYVAQGVTDDKGNLSFSVPKGTYTVATFYNDEWETHGPFNVKNSKENVIRLGK